MTINSRAICIMKSVHFDSFSLNSVPYGVIKGESFLV